MNHIMDAALYYYTWVIIYNADGWIAFSKTIKTFYNPYSAADIFYSINPDIDIVSYPSKVQPQDNVTIKFNNNFDNAANNMSGVVNPYKAVLTLIDSSTSAETPLSTIYLDPDLNVSTDQQFQATFPITWAEGTFTMKVYFYIYTWLPNDDPRFAWDTEWTLNGGFTKSNLAYLATSTFSITIFADRPYLLYIGIGALSICIIAMLANKNITNKVYMKTFAKLRKYDIDTMNKAEAPESTPSALPIPESLTPTKGGSQ
jgi:hypothetical protein